ncbi:MAG TPA: L,D-transpeptidase [Longimicrobiaceae bacterium]
MPIPSLISVAVALGSLLPWSAGPERASALADPAPAAAIQLEVSLSDRQLRVMQEGTLLRSYPVAIGQEKYPTPRGTFSIARIVWNPRWVPPKAPWAKGKTAKEPGDPDNPMGKVKLFFKEPDYYIHGTQAEESLGQAASHGCVRMANSDVVEVAQLVMEHGGEARPQSWFARILNLVRPHEVRLSNRVPITIVQ